MRKIPKLFLLLLLVASTLLSCTPADGGEETTAAEESESTAELPTLQLIESGMSAYEIIYPDQGDTEALKAATELGNLFAKEGGVRLNTNTDYLQAGKTHDGENFKILVGRTNYPESVKAYEGLRYYDYRIAIEGTHLVIAAYQEKGYEAALKWLTDNVFSNVSGSKGDETLVIKTDVQIGSAKLPSTMLTDWRIAGKSLEEYKIVYDSNMDPAAMEQFRLQLAKKTNFYLEMQPDTEAELSDYEILIGDTNRVESTEVEAPKALHYTFKVINGKLAVKTAGAHTLEKVMSDFVQILSQGEKKINMTAGFEWTDSMINDPYNVSFAAGTNLRLMTANVMANIPNYNDLMREANFDFNRCAEIFYAHLDFYKPTVIGLQECCMDWNRAIKEYDEFESKWALLEFQNPNPGVKKEFVMSTIMYRKDLLTLVDSGMQYYTAYNNGRCRCITWAILRDNATGKEFCFASTHWDGGTDANGSEMPNTMVQVAEMTAFVNKMAEKYPVYTTGDFNRNEYTEAFKKYLKDTNSLDCMYAAEKRLNKLGSWHTWGQLTSSAGSCDHITVTSKDTKVLQFETLIYNDQHYASDHSWLIADIQFK